jgi:hypothetical protein
MRSHFTSLPSVLSAAKQMTIGIKILATKYWWLVKDITSRFHIASKVRISKI